MNVLSAKIRGTEMALPTFGRVSRPKRRTVLCLEDMMDRIQKGHDEKIKPKRATDGKRGSYSRRK